MAESEANQTTEPLAQMDGEEKHLKYLDFVQNAVIYFVVCFSTVYEYAKENSGPLKPGVQTVESTVKTVIGPLYERFQDVPSEVLKFVDMKVDDTLNEVHRHIPSLMKQVPEVARKLTLEVQHDGLVNTVTKVAKTVYTKYEPTAKELYTNYEPVVEKYAVSTWRGLNRLPLFPQVAHVVVPTAAYWVQKYNHVVCYTAEKGYPVARYLPLVPVEKIAKVFEDGENGHINGQSVQIET